MDINVNLKLHGVTVGTATVRRVNKNLAYLCKVHITPTCRGKGYYPMLRDRARHAAQEAGYRGWIFTVRPDNIRHYRRMVERFGPPINHHIMDQHVAGLWWESFNQPREN